MNMTTHHHYCSREKVLQVVPESSGHPSGFTLIELMIAMVMGLVLLAALYSFFIFQNKELKKQEQITEMQQNARMAMDMISRDLAMAGFGGYNATAVLPRCTGTTTAANAPCVGITAANANSISFAMDVTGDTTTGGPDGDRDDANENITYDLYTSDGVPTLGRKSSTTAVKQPVLSYVSSLSFSYLPATGTTATTNLADIRRVQISITTRTANTDPDTGNYHYFTLTSIVALRNLQLPGF
jgi:type IV pilus assembly protein PilW